MFRPSVTAFIDHAQDLYTAGAFDPPATPVPPPPPNPEWLSYDGPNNHQSPVYQQFRASSNFLRVHSQWLDRLDDCERFALRHCSEREARDILAGLRTFKQRLRDGFGEPYVGNAMPLLFGQGKLAMDRVCQRLEQDALPLDFRRMQLREMSSQLHLCMSTGPAFIQAAAALDIAPQGLHGAFHAAVQARATDVLRQTFQTEQANSPWQAAMEVHGVNRMLLEYRLPGGDLTDTLSFGSSLFQPDESKVHLTRLREALDPCLIAEDLADRYWEELSIRLPPEVPPRWSADDLNESMPAIAKAVAELDVALSPVALTNLLVEDETSSTVRWQSDSSLLALALLEALEREQLVTPQDRDIVLTVYGQDSAWQMNCVHQRLFHVVESFQRRTSPLPQPVRLSHALALERGRKKFTRTLPMELVSAVIRGESSDQLKRIPLAWLTRTSQIRDWLRRMDGDDWAQWIQDAPPLDLPQVHRLVGALTDLARSNMLEQLLTSPLMAGHVALRDSGEKMIRMALDATDPETQAAWRRYLIDALPSLSAQRVYELLSPRQGPTLLSNALTSGHAHRVVLTVDLIQQGVIHGLVPLRDVPYHLDCPLEHALEHGHLEVLEVLGRFLLKALDSRWLERDALEHMLGVELPGSLCDTAMIAGEEACLVWYLTLVRTLHERQHLSRTALLSLVADRTQDSSMISYEAASLNRSPVLRIYLTWLMDAMEQGVVSKNRLLSQLTCNGPEQSGLAVLVGEDHEPSLEVWCECLVLAVRRKLITGDDVTTLMACLDKKGKPLLHDLVVFHHAFPLNQWMTVLARLCEQQALDLTQLTALLRGGVGRQGPLHAPQSRPLLLELMRRWQTEHMVSYVIRMTGLQGMGLLPEQALESLLRATDPRDQRPALAWAVSQRQHEVVDAYLNLLSELGRERRLSSAALVRLVDGRQPPGTDATEARSVLVTAIRNKDLKSLELLINAALEMCQHGHISSQDWATLLMPDAPAEDPMAVLRKVNHLPSLGFIRNTLITANGLEILSKNQARLLLEALPPAVRPSPEPASG